MIQGGRPHPIAAIEIALANGFGWWRHLRQSRRRPC